MADATIPLEKFNDPTQWDHVDYGLPIFTEHELWECPHPWLKDVKAHVIVYPGDEKPKTGSKLYSIGAPELEETAKKINAALARTTNPIGMTIGHRNKALPENQQPKTVAYAVGAKVGTIGDGSIRAVLADKICYVKGQYSECKTYPHRSPEFAYMTGDMTGLAFLRNDPKLRMGIMSYSQSTVEYASDAITVYYGTGLDESDKPKKKEGGDKPPKGKEGGEDDVPVPLQAKGTQQDPTKPPTASDPDPVEHEAWKVHMEKFKREDPMMLQMSKDYESKSAEAMAPEPSPLESGKKPPPKEEGKVKDEEPENMADNTPTVNYADFQALAAKVDTLAAANVTLGTKYAASEATRYVSRVRASKVVKDAKKLLDRFLAFQPTDDAGRKGLFDDVMENYADLPLEDRDPSRAEPIEVYNEGGVEGDHKDPVIADPMDMTEAVRYAEENKLDFDKDYVQIAKAMSQRNGRAPAKVA